MELRQIIELEAKDTIGYYEAENKESFMVGVSVAFGKIKIRHDNEMAALKTQLGGYKSLYEDAIADLKTLASIINRYSDND